MVNRDLNPQMMDSGDEMLLSNDQPSRTNKKPRFYQQLQYDEGEEDESSQVRPSLSDQRPVGGMQHQGIANNPDFQSPAHEYGDDDEQDQQQIINNAQNIASQSRKEQLGSSDQMQDERQEEKPQNLLEDQQSIRKEEHDKSEQELKRGVEKRNFN